MREGETNGVQHYYITPEEMQELLKAKDVIAYAKKESGVKYAATYHSLADESIYIVDPTGIYYLREHYSDKIDLYVINLICPEDTVEERIKSRGDDWNMFLEREERMNMRSLTLSIYGIFVLIQRLMKNLCTIYFVVTTICYNKIRSIMKTLYSNCTGRYKNNIMQHCRQC